MYPLHLQGRLVLGPKGMGWIMPRYKRGLQRRMERLFSNLQETSRQAITFTTINTLLILPNTFRMYS